MPDAIKGRKKVVGPLAQTKQRMVCLPAARYFARSWNEKINPGEEGHRAVPKRPLCGLRGCARVCACCSPAARLSPVCGSCISGVRSMVGGLCEAHAGDAALAHQPGPGGGCSTRGTSPRVLEVPGEAGERNVTQIPIYDSEKCTLK